MDPTATLPPRPSPSSLLRRLFLFCLLVNLTLSGGRIASSDGNTMFAVSESLLAGRLSIPPGWNGSTGRDGAFYAKADPGQAILALPWVAIGRLTTPLIPGGAAIRNQWPRVVTSTLNAFAGAAAVVAFLLLVRSLGYRTGHALLLALGLAVSTPLLPYTKSFLREPLLMLALLLAVLSARRGGWGACGLWLGAGMVIKASMVLQVPLLLLYAWWRRGAAADRFGGTTVRLLSGPAVAVLVLALHNWVRFESVFRTGYDPTVDVFSTPLLVGVYGQLLSSGKSLFLYAPLGLAALWGYRGLLRHHPAEGRLVIAILVVNVLFHARFASWAGEGSWGPRYLVPFLPLFILPAAELLQSGRRWPRRSAVAALVLGVLVQVGGTAIYFGSYMREIGEYPYRRGFTDPEFMVRSHFVPNYTPVVGHWRLLIRNTRLLWSEERPRWSVETTPRTGEADPPGAAPRLPLSAADQATLPYVLDLWFCYALYAGFPGLPVTAIVLVAFGGTTAAGLALRRVARLGVDPRPDPCPWETG